jgi:hypothetical protein
MKYFNPNFDEQTAKNIFETLKKSITDESELKLIASEYELFTNAFELRNLPEDAIFFKRGHHAGKYIWEVDDIMFLAKLAFARKEIKDKKRAFAIAWQFKELIKKADVNTIADVILSDVE